MARILMSSPETIGIAAAALRRGGLVAFATETVYGLGADATDDRAVARIFEAKGRPRFNPLIVHVADKVAARRLTVWNATAERLAAGLWPGPLTFVLPRQADCPVSLLCSAGLDTLAIRCPVHDGARALIAATGRPIAAPSANRSGAVSPTCAAHVAESLGDAVDLILDGGPCAVGLESTVLDLTGPVPALLRPGGATRAAIEAVAGPIRDAAHPDQDGPRLSPGQLTSHYAPARPLRLGATTVAADEALLAFGPGVPAGARATLNLSPAGDLVEAAANLFAMLRALDKPDVRAIAAMPVPVTGLGEAINDRLRRAAAR